MLIPLLCFSQEGIGNKVILDFEIAKMIAFDLEEKDRLVIVDSVKTIQIQNLNKQVEVLEEVSGSKSTQISLLYDTNQILQSQLEAEKLNKPKSKWFTWVLAVIGAFGTGYILGQ
jgi:hypothetical protein